MKNALTLLLAIFCFAKLPAQTVTLTPHNAPNTLNWLIAIEKAPGDNRLYAVQKDGYVRIVNTDGTVLPMPFLDLSAKVNNSFNNEQGLLGLAFHPNYQQNGLFYVFYNEIGTGKCIISRFLRSLANPDQANSISEGILLTFDHPNPNHVGGCMKFGPDGYLYIGTGDGGGAGDPNGNGQNLLSFMGKILRIEVGSGTYSVPADNPFVGVANTAPEIWAYGLRNPWRFNFDSFTGSLWIGDVGQDTREEVNFQPSNSPGGEDYGWSCYEGTLPFNSNQCFAGSVYTDPLYEYENSGADCSVTGGTVYRGTQYADLFGKYLYTDFCSGKIRTVLNDGIPTVAEVGDFTNNDFTALEAGPDGELYVVGFFSNTIYKIKSNNCAPVAWLVAEPNIALPTGGNALLNVFGNGMNYQWLLNGNPINGATANSLTVSTPGTYSVVVTNPVGGCSNTSNATVVTMPAPLTVSLTVQDVSCFGDSDGSITALAVGGSQNYTYLWSNGATTASIIGLSAGTYSVTVDDGNGTVIASATVSEPVAMVLNLDGIAPTTANNGVLWVTVGNGQSPFGVLWSNGETNDTIYNLSPGTYSVTVFDGNGCQETDTINLLVNGTNEIGDDLGLHVYPNPVVDELRISLNLSGPSGLGIGLFDGMGRQVVSVLPYGQMGAGEMTVQASTTALPPGVYFVVVNLDGKMAVRKVVKR
ncbi:MAG: PQQ-dependent sugar dehydrogenase [Saprospiraceae bacterium]|nr:PQQ-dependent sugar dehydrogenase [Saprospiraceae bacterium]MCF8282126.1 PQQ-dependent sugar dehydrogenase [Bacteroidales bacterium]